ncbi:MAG: hypothetical protein ACI9TV_001642 [Sulfurimonas sp.]|jgi:hypothetical protein|uniref:hypothetical protein n=1 Tax=Sulfurimonas sp. TaxID=2022749 RepID=UPI0039E3EC66
MLSNHEQWRLSYRENRYMEYLNEDELMNRTNDILYNLLIVGENGKISFRKTDDNDGKYWMILFTESLEEFVLRSESNPNEFEYDFIKKENIIKPDLETKALKAIKELNIDMSKSIYKFSQYEYNKNALDFGEIQISPASSYYDEKLNEAIRDNELQFDIITHPSKVTITNKKNNTKVKPLGNITSTYQLSSDYFIQSLAGKYTYREYDDFECDSCLIITDISRYIENIKKEMAKHINKFEFYFDYVEYIDPLKIRMEVRPNIIFSKHFKYAYQNECRIVIIPKEKTNKLEKFLIKIGPMHEYAKLVTIKQ